MRASGIFVSNVCVFFLLLGQIEIIPFVDKSPTQGEELGKNISMLVFEVIQYTLPPFDCVCVCDCVSPAQAALPP